MTFKIQLVKRFTQAKPYILDRISQKLQTQKNVNNFSAGMQQWVMAIIVQSIIKCIMMRLNCSIEACTKYVIKRNGRNLLTKCKNKQVPKTISN